MLGKRFVPIGLGALALVAGINANATATHHPVASATLQLADGTPAGTATVLAHGKGLMLQIDAKGLSQGEHGAHIHAVGKCETPGFTTAGSHLNPFGKMHGMKNPQGRHLGDLPNLVVGPDGKGSLTIHLDGKRADLEPLLFDADGAAIVIHATADDLQTDPSGNSGARLACGILQKAN